MGRCQSPTRFFEWYSDWLEVAKAMCTFLNNRQYLKQLKAKAVRLGCMDRYLRLKGFCANFIKWRWGTLHKVCQEIKAVWIDFIFLFDPQEYRFSELVRELTKALVQRFIVETGLLSAFSAVIEHFRGRVRGCQCHPQECRAAFMKGSLFVCLDGRKGLNARFTKVWVDEFLSSIRDLSR